MRVKYDDNYYLEFTKEDARWGKYDSGFHAYLVECVEPDEYAGDTDYGGCVRYGKRLDYWTSDGFHSLVTCATEEEAQAWFAEFERGYDSLDDDESDYEEARECAIHPGRTHELGGDACRQFSLEQQVDESDELDYIWPAPTGTGWIDAWNGWYLTEAEAREDAAPGVGQPWILHYGEGLITQEEADYRREG